MSLDAHPPSGTEQLTISFWSKGGHSTVKATTLFESGTSLGRNLNVHLPWENSRIHWDAGSEGVHDGLNKEFSEYSGAWIHWVLQKDANLGIMRIYKNGVLFEEGYDKTRPMGAEVDTFKVGASRYQGNWWKGLLDETQRICHGDLKISNLHFNEEDEVCALLDLDTVAKMGLSVEMGDAWRSWCNRGGEDQSESQLDVAIFEASLRGYCRSRRLTPREGEGLEWGPERIALELAARFLIDALEESYFGWDSSRFESRGDHNLLRGQGQLALASSVASQRHAMTRALQRVLSEK